MPPLIVKLGGSVITDKRKRLAVRLAVIKRLAGELASVKGPLIVVHGGGSFGHPMAEKYGLAGGYKSERQLRGFSLTHRAMEKLNAHVVEALQREGVPAVAVQPSACAVVRKGKLVSMELTPVRKMLELGLVPILYGDVVPDLDQGISILSGDKILVHLARQLGAKRVILGVDVEGVCTADPKVRKEAELVPVITPGNWPEVRGLMGRVGAPDVTGGMAGKITELLGLAEQGVEVEVVNATRPRVLKRAALGERGLGTRITAG